METIRIYYPGFAGEPVELAFTHSGCVCCPVCANVLPSAGMYIQTYLFGAYEECTDCKTEFGITDIDEVPPTRENPAAMRYAKLRHKWLEKNSWDEHLIKRVEERLGVVVDVSQGWRMHYKSNDRPVQGEYKLLQTIRIQNIEERRSRNCSHLDSDGSEYGRRHAL